MYSKEFSRSVDANDDFSRFCLPMEEGVTFRIKTFINEVFQRVLYFMAKYTAIIFLYLQKKQFHVLEHSCILGK